MTLVHPAVLALIPIALAAIWYTMARARRHEAPAGGNIHRLWADFRGIADRPRMTRRWRGALFALGAIAALCALARPQWGAIPEQRVVRSREVLLALDLSRSMLADDVSPTRLARAKLLIEALLDQLRGERVGLLVFAGTAFTQSPLSPDYEVLRELLAELDPSYLPHGGSNYEAMLAGAVRAFGERDGTDRFLVVLSDGEAHDDGWKTSLPALRERGVRVIGLGVGTPAGALLPAAGGGALEDDDGNAVRSRLDASTLQELAAATGGTYRDAASWVDIAALVDATVAQGRAGRHVEERGMRLQDRFQWFLAPAVALLMLSLWRDFPLSPLGRARATRRTAAAGAALMALVAFQAPGLARAAVSELPPPPDAAAPQANPLAATVAALIAKPDLQARDYARLASATIDFAAQPAAPPGAPRTGMLDDALAGVERGEQLDPRAADWPALRAALERLKQAERQQPADQPDSEQQGASEQARNGGAQRNAEPDDSADGGEGGQDTGGAGDEQSQSAAQESSGPRSSTDHAASQPDPEQPSGGASAGEPAADDTREAAQASGEVPRRDTDELLEAAGLGDEQSPRSESETIESRPAQERTRQAPADARMVGGGRAMEPAAPEGALALADALGRMQQVEEGDAPAVLFERMNRVDGQARVAATDRDW